MSVPAIPADGSIWTKEFWKAAAERAIRTAAIAAALVLVGDTYETMQVNAFAVDFWRMLGFALGGAMLSLLLSIGAHARTHRGPDFVPMEQAPRRALPEDGEEGP